VLALLQSSSPPIRASVLFSKEIGGLVALIDLFVVLKNVEIRRAAAKLQCSPWSQFISL